MNATRAVLFDLDGTLVDSAPDIAAAMNHALDQLQLRPLSRSAITHGVGQGPRVLVERILALQDTLDAAQRQRLAEPLLAAYLLRYQSVIGTHGRLFPDVSRVVRELRAGGLKLGVVTNALQAPAQAILDRYGLGGVFDALISSDRVTHRKPHPEPVQTACRLLGVEPGAALMVGDSASDIQAAHAAGCAAVGVSHGYNEGHALTSLDCPILDGFAALPGFIAALSRHGAAPASPPFMSLPENSHVLHQPAPTA